MSLALLLESALRALGLGAGVWLFLRLTRLRDTPTETLIWTMVLLMALAMPVLMPALERWSPALALHLPRLAQVSGNISPVAIAANPNWLAAHGAALLWSLYFLIAAIGVARLALGLVLTARLYRRAQPVRASWAQGRAIRASAAIRGPIAFGTAILLPADYRNWPQAKLAAVLAHEESHVRRGDFFIQLLASLYRALFWFSPFAWWLQTHLCALGESASDAAAVRVAGDRACYAEILIEVSRQAQSLGGLSVAMAKGPDIAWRIDRILDESAAERALGQKARLATAAMILPLALAIAGAHAAIPAPLQMAQAVRAVPAARPAASAAKAAPATSTPIPTSRPALRPVRPAPPVQAEAPAPPEETVSYNPRALLDGPTIAMVPALIVTGGSQ